MLLNVDLIQLRGLQCLKYGAYHNVYIVDIQQTEPLIFKTFYRRLNTIIKVDRTGKCHYERVTEREDCDDEIDLKQGLTKVISKVYDIDVIGIRY